MKLYDGNEMIGGWYIGDFVPSVFRTKDFEVCIKNHPKGEEWPAHFHAEAIEINYLISGMLHINGIYLGPKAIFVLDKHEVSQPEFISDCVIVVVKVPSVPGDKIVVGGNKKKEELWT